jgi:nucleotide-binding universal stress UspA family protein
VSYKTILMHCNDKRRIAGLLAPTVRLAETFQSHLIGLSIVPPISVVAGGVPGAPPITIDAHCQLYREENPARRAAFDAAVQGRGLVAEWIDDDAGAFSVAESALPYARTADLVVAGQTDPEWALTDWLDIPDRLAMESGRPVLIIPNAGGAREDIGEKVVVAWNGRREASRAVFDSLPLLQRAKSVKIVCVNRESEPETAADLPTAGIAAALARHGVRCEATELARPRENAGKALIDCAKDSDADLLVMGCYGHTRFREMVFGGASRYVLAHMPIPVLMSH